MTMRRILLAALALAAAGCGWHNPYDSRDVQEDLDDAEERVMYTTRLAAWGSEPPPVETLRELQPNLDHWRATVVDTADYMTLSKMRDESLVRLQALRAQQAEWASSRQRVVWREQVVTSHEAAVEALKLAIINDRMQRKLESP